MIRLACERPADSEVPLARWSSSELAAEVITRGICEQISGITVWRWLSEDAIKPWQYRSWIFPRDPRFTEKAGRILDLYAGRWNGELLHPGDYVVCCDEKPSIQARARKHATLPAKPGAKRGQRVEHEYERCGALCYFAAWDVRRAKLFDRCDEKDGIVPFDKLVEQFMSVEPYNKARRVFVIVETVPSNYSFGRCDFGLVDEIELEMGGGRDPLAALLLDRRTERDAQALAVAAVGGELVVADPVVHRAA